MAVESGQPRNPVLYFASSMYSAEVLGVQELSVNHPRNKLKEVCLRLLLRPHENLKHSIHDWYEKTPITDKENRDGDYPKMIYPKRLFKTVSLDPSYPTWIVLSNFEGTSEITKIGFDDEQFTIQLKNALMDNKTLKAENSKKNLMLKRLSEQDNFKQEIKDIIVLTMNKGFAMMAASKEGKREERS